MKKHLLILFIVFSLSLASLATADNFVYDGKNARDPFWPLVSSEGVLITYDTEFVISDLNLEGIMFSTKEQSVAIIDGKVLRVNDKMGDYSIDQIQPDKVILKKADQTFELKLKKGE